METGIVSAEVSLEEENFFFEGNLEEEVFFFEVLSSSRDSAVTF